MYVKNSLVPFAETDGINAGNEQELFHFRNKIIVPMVCYDTVFLTNYINHSKVDLIIAVSNDALADGTTIPMLHASITKMYAKSVSIPLLFISQSSESFFVDVRGYIEVFSNLFQRDTVSRIITF